MHFFLSYLAILTLTFIGFQLFNSAVTALNVTPTNNYLALPASGDRPFDLVLFKIFAYLVTNNNYKMPSKPTKSLSYIMVANKTMFEIVLVYLLFQYIELG